MYRACARLLPHQIDAFTPLLAASARPLFTASQHHLLLRTTQSLAHPAHPLARPDSASRRRSSLGWSIGRVPGGRRFLRTRLKKKKKAQKLQRLPSSYWEAPPDLTTSEGEQRVSDSTFSAFRHWKGRVRMLKHLDGASRRAQAQAQGVLEARVRAPPREAPPPPSAASGGVPEPTAAYRAQAAAEPRRLDAAQPLLVVIDLNGTLLHRPDSRRSPTAFVRRPFAALFLNYCVRTFWVVVWSSARPENAGVLCRNLLTPDRLRDGVVAVWARDRFGLTPDDYARRVQCYKRLSALWTDPVVARSHPHYAAGGRWSQANTVLIDDSAEKARTEPHNVVVVPSFVDAGDPHEGILPVVHDYLNELCFAADVSAYMRAHPFVAPTDWEVLAAPPKSLALYDGKQKKRDKKKAKRDYAQPPPPPPAAGPAGKK